MINGFQPLTIFAESSITDVQLGSKYVSDKDSKFAVNLFPERHSTVKRREHFNLSPDMALFLLFLQGV